MVLIVGSSCSRTAVETTPSVHKKLLQIAPSALPHYKAGISANGFAFTSPEFNFGTKNQTQILPSAKGTISFPAHTLHVFLKFLQCVSLFRCKISQKINYELSFQERAKLGMQ